MSTRRQAREWAVQMLFELDLNPAPERTPEQLFDEFWTGQLRLRGPEEAPGAPPDERSRTFTETLVRGVIAHRAEIDARIQERTRNWKLERIGSVERAVLRLGVFEIVFAEDPAPAPVVINEAIDLAKYFGTAESGRFVNGILDAVARRHRAERSRDASRSEVWTPGAPGAERT